MSNTFYRKIVDSLDNFENDELSLSNELPDFLKKVFDCFEKTEEFKKWELGIEEDLTYYERLLEWTKKATHKELSVTFSYHEIVELLEY